MSLLKPVIPTILLVCTSFGFVPLAGAEDETSPRLTIDVDVAPGEEVSADDIDSLIESVEPHESSDAIASLTVGELPEASSNLTIDLYDSVPSDVVDVVVSAFNEWDQSIDRNGVPMKIELYYRDLGNSGLLAAAGPYLITSNGVEYPVAVVSAQMGYDVEPNFADMVIYINSSRSWNTSLSPTPINDGNFLLRTVMLHEMGHGLGIVSNSTASSDGTGTPTSFDVGFHNGKHQYDPMWGTQPNSYQTSDHVWFLNTDFTWERIHAPSVFAKGSSMSHLAEGLYTAGSPGSLMTPYLNQWENIYELDGVVLGLASKAGWRMLSAPGETLLNLSYDNGIRFRVGPSKVTSYVPAVWYELDLRDSTGTILTTEWFYSDEVPLTKDLGWQYLSSRLPDGNYTVTIRSYSNDSVYVSGTPLNITVSNVLVPGYRGDLEAQVSRIYSAYFLRSPDTSGMTYWRTSRANGMSINEVSQVFSESPEFNSRYGSLNDSEFVDLVYLNVLDRHAEPSGRTYWLGQLSSGTTRGEMMVGFFDSVEFIAASGHNTPLTTIESDVWRLYAAVFARNADTAGLGYWVTQYNTLGIQNVATFFTNSVEFNSKYGALDNKDFIELIYLNVLGRSADTNGQIYWNSLLDMGATRGDIIEGFSNSPEFILKTDTLPVN